MTYLLLFWEFFKTGLFAIGGGYATLPFLTEISQTYGWYTTTQLASFIAISEVTPGPIGINVATFAGYVTTGVLGGIIASVALVLPALIIILTLSTLLPNYRENTIVKKIFYGIIPVAIGLLTATAYKLFSLALFTQDTTGSMIGAWALLIILLLLYLPKLPVKISPYIILLIGAVWGFFFL